jgi:hypothetical protein
MTDLDKMITRISIPLINLLITSNLFLNSQLRSFPRQITLIIQHAIVFCENLVMEMLFAAFQNLSAVSI